MLIPDGPLALTSEQLTQALRETGTIKNAAVSSFYIQAIGEEGEGITGQLARVILTYDHTESGAPKTLIAKFHAADAVGRNGVNPLGMYKNEFQFYKHIASQTEIPVSRCYYCDYQKSGMTVLLLEDLSPSRSFGWDINTTQVEMTVRHAAKLHAFWWEHPQLDEVFGREDFAVIQNVWNSVQNTAQEKWPIVLELAKDNMPPEMTEIGEQIVYKWAAIANQLLYQSPRTFTHGDLNGDNLLFTTQQSETFSVIDWQLSRRGRGVYDVGMLLGGIPTDQRRKTEQSLLKEYYQILTDNGVKGYSFTQCFDDYRLTLLDTFARPVFVIRRPHQNEDLDRYRATDHKFREVELPRRCAAILDLEAEKLIPR